MSKETKLASIKKGDWVKIFYGYQYRKFLIIENNPMERHMIILSPKWLSTDTEKVYYDTMLVNPEPHIVRIGFGFKRWWWDYLPKSIKQFVMPYNYHQF